MNFLTRVFGGSPLATLLKLVFLSLVVGAIMVGFGLTPATILDRVTAAVRSLYRLGFGAIRNVGQYVLTGALIVIPVWIVLRVLQGRR